MLTTSLLHSFLLNPFSLHSSLFNFLLPKAHGPVRHRPRLPLSYENEEPHEAGIIPKKTIHRPRSGREPCFRGIYLRNKCLPLLCFILFHFILYYFIQKKLYSKKKRHRRARLCRTSPKESWSFLLGNHSQKEQCHPSEYNHELSHEVIRHTHHFIVKFHSWNPLPCCIQTYNLWKNIASKRNHIEIDVT